MSEKELTREEYEEAIRLATAGLKQLDRKEMEAEPWGTCECGRKFTMWDRLNMLYCPTCGRKLVKDV